MADAIPTPEGTTPPQAQSTVIVPQPLTQWQALKEAGWWTPYDWFVTILFFSLWIVTGFWFLFSTPHPEGPSRTTVLLLIFMAGQSLQMVWLISLAFRCSWFVLKAHADIAMLPHASARIAAAFLAGQK